MIFLIQSDGHRVSKRSSLVICNIVTLAGKLARLGEAAPWVYHLMTHIYPSIAYALRVNEKMLLTSDESFVSLIKKIKSYREKEEVDVKYLNFFLSKAAKKKMTSTRHHEAVKSLVIEIELLRAWLAGWPQTLG